MTQLGEHLHQVVGVSRREHLREEQDELLGRQGPLHEYFGGGPIVVPLAKHVVAPLVLQAGVVLQLELLELVLYEHRCKARRRVEHLGLHELLYLQLWHQLAQFHQDLHPLLLSCRQDDIHGVEHLHF